MARVISGDLEWEGESFQVEVLKAKVACRLFLGKPFKQDPRERIDYREDEPTTPHSATVSATDEFGDRLCYIVLND